MCCGCRQTTLYTVGLFLLASGFHSCAHTHTRSRRTATCVCILSIAFARHGGLKSRSKINPSVAPWWIMVCASRCESRWFPFRNNKRQILGDLERCCYETRKRMRKRKAKAAKKTLLIWYANALIENSFFELPNLVEFQCTNKKENGSAMVSIEYVFWARNIEKSLDVLMLAQDQSRQSHNEQSQEPIRTQWWNLMDRFDRIPAHFMNWIYSYCNL